MPGGGALHAQERMAFLRKHQKTPQQTKIIHRQAFNQHRQQQEQQAPMEQNNFQREKQHFGSQVAPTPPPSSQSKQSTTILFLESQNQASGMVLPARKNRASNIRSNACSVAATLMVFFVCLFGCWTFVWFHIQMMYQVSPEVVGRLPRVLEEASSKQNDETERAECNEGMLSMALDNPPYHCADHVSFVLEPMTANSSKSNTSCSHAGAANFAHRAAESNASFGIDEPDECGDTALHVAASQALDQVCPTICTRRC